MKKLIFLSEVSNELFDILAWYRTKSPSAANRFYSEYQRTIRRIQDLPQAFPKRDDAFRRANLHRFPYYVLFHEHEGTVQVVAIAHAKRRPGYWRDRLPEV